MNLLHAILNLFGGGDAPAIRGRRGPAPGAPGRPGNGQPGFRIRPKAQLDGSQVEDRRGQAYFPDESIRTKRLAEQFALLQQLAQQNNRTLRG